MASIPVNNNLKVLTAIVNQTANAPDMQGSLNTKQEQAMQDSFGAVMNRVNSQNSQSQSSQAENKAASQTSASKASTPVSGKSLAAGIASAGQTPQKTGKDNAVNAGTKQSVPTKADRTVAKADTAEAENTVLENGQDAQQETVRDAADKMVEEVAQEMDVTPEEVEEAMEVLGLSVVQLLDPENMKQLLLTLSGNEDHLSIVTDAELYGHLQNLLGALSEGLEALQSELGLTQEDLSALIADMAVVESLDADGMEILEAPVTAPEQNGDTEPAGLEGMKDYAVTIHKDGETVEIKVTVDDASGEQTSKEAVTAADQTQPRHDARQNDQGASKGGRGEENAADSFPMQTPTQQPEVSEIPQQPILERFVSTEDIMNQIMEYMKINLKGDVQELEMQLHPASLGTVNIQIAAKDGMITAQFTAQNETVKAAIESQLVQLKTQFEEQGLKVDAVEVTVANYRFEQSFSGQSQNEEETAGGKKGRRKINLGELDLEELPEDMDDSERIAAEMMAASGNTVDYTA